MTYSKKITGPRIMTIAITSAIPHGYELLTTVPSTGLKVVTLAES